MADTRTGTLAALVVVATGLTGAPALSAPDPAAKCAATKVEVQGRRATQELVCHAKAVRRAEALDPACVARAQARLVSAYERPGDCLDPSHVGAAELRVGAFVGHVVTELGDAGGRCTARKYRATGRKVRGLAKCHSTALGLGVAVDPACVTRVEARFDAAFTRADADGGCAGAAATVEDRVEAVVAVLVDSATTPCEATLFPLCDGVCGDAGVCGPDLGSFAFCICYLPTTACGGTYPVCNGECPAGETCRQTGTIPTGSCTCEP